MRTAKQQMTWRIRAARELLLALAMAAAPVTSHAVTPPGNFEFAYYQGVEGKAITVTIFRPGVVGNFAISITVTDQYAVSLEPQTRTVTWAANDGAPKYLDFTLANDAEARADGWGITAFTQIEAFTGAGSKIGVSNLEWRDNDIAISLAQAAISAAENGSVQIPVRRSGTVGSETVEYATADGSAIGGSDYTPVKGTLTWNDGELAEKLVTVPINTDAINENNETFTLTLTNPQIVTGGAESIRLGQITQTTVTIINAAVNEPPVANDYAAATPEDTTLTIDLLTSEIAWDAESDFFVSAIPVLPARGTVTFDGHTVRYTPTADFFGNDTFDYTVSDLQGATATATITVTVNARNDTPVISEPVLQRKTAIGVPLELDLTGILSDPDGDSLVISSAAGAQNGEISIGDGTLSITYFPNAEFTGTDQFTYTVSDMTDSNNGTTEGTIIVTVAAPNNPPQAQNLQLNASAGQPVIINLGNAVSDPDNTDALVVIAPEKTAHGSTSVSGLVITYQPDPGFAGEDTFDYTVTDGFGGVATASITVKIAGVVPLATALNITLPGGEVRLVRLNSAFRMEVQVNDEANVAVPGVQIQWSAVEQRGGQPVALTAEENVTDDTGSARATLITSSTPTTYEVTVTATLPETEISDSATFTVATGLHAITLPNTPEGALAGALDDFCPKLAALGESLTAQEQALVDRCNEIFGAATDGNDAQILHALRALAPEESAAQGRIGNRVSMQQVGNIASRLAALRSGASGAALSGLAFNIKGESVPGTVLAELLGPDARGGGASADPVVGAKWGAFVSGTLGGGEKKRTDREEGFDFQTLGLTAGADYRFTNTFVLGAALGYANTALDLNRNGGDLDAGGISLSLYGTWYQTERLYVDAVLNYGSNNYDMTRKVDYTVGATTVSKTARADTDSGLLALSLGGGYEVATQSGITAEASVRFTYVDSTIDGYNETGADELNLKLKDQNIDVLTSSLGGRVSWPFSLKWGVLVPQFNLSWEHEFDDGAHQIKGSFVADRFQTRFAFDTDEPDRDYFGLSLGVSAIWPGGSTAFAQYQSTLGRDNFSDYNVALGLRVELPW
jgi:outer membrane autotransporter protein